MTPNQSQTYTVDVWIPADDSDRFNLRESLDHLAADLGADEKSRWILLGLPSIVEEPVPGEDAIAIRFRWVDVDGGTGLDAAAKIIDFLQRLAHFMPVFRTHDFYVRTHTEQT